MVLQLPERDYPAILAFMHSFGQYSLMPVLRPVEKMDTDV